MASKKSTLSLAVASAFGSALLVSTAVSAADPFEMKSLDRGYQVAELKDGNGMPVRTADSKAKEAKCGGDKAKEGKCGGDKAKEGKCGGDKKKEGKCGEGKCGGSK